MGLLHGNWATTCQLNGRASVGLNVGGQEEPPRHESLQEELLVCPSQW